MRYARRGSRPMLASKFMLALLLPVVGECRGGAWGMWITRHGGAIRASRSGRQGILG